MGFHEMQKEAWDALSNFQTVIARYPSGSCVRRRAEDLVKSVDAYLVAEAKTQGFINEKTQSCLLKLQEQTEEAWRACTREVKFEDLVWRVSINQLMEVTRKHRRILEQFQKRRSDSCVSFDTLAKQCQIFPPQPYLTQAAMPKEEQSMYHVSNFSGYASPNNTPFFGEGDSCRRTVDVETLMGDVHAPNITPNTAQTMIHHGQREESDDLRDWAELSQRISAYVGHSEGTVGNCIDDRVERDSESDRSSNGTGINFDDISWQFQKLDVDVPPYTPQRSSAQMQKIKGNHQ